MKNLVNQVKIFFSSDSHRGQLAFFRQFIGDRSLVFDIGAHKGDKTALFRKLGARVVAVEPQPAIFQKLKERFYSDEKVILVEKGVGANIGKLNLKICSKAPTISTFAADWDKGRFKDYIWDETAEINMTTLNDLIQKYGQPDYCKIDVEGFEDEVLLGLKSKIPLLSFEFTAEQWDRTKNTLSHLSTLGFKQFNFALAENASLACFAFVDLETAKTEIELIIKKDHSVWGDIYCK